MKKRGEVAEERPSQWRREQREPSSQWLVPYMKQAAEHQQTADPGAAALERDERDVSVCSDQ